MSGEHVAHAGRRGSTLLGVALMLLAGCRSGFAREQKSDRQTDEDRREQAAADSMVGKRPPEWQTTLWVNSPPLKLADLRGKVVLVRWWTAGCPFCSASAPALRSLDHRYRERGLTVIGMYHHKEPTPFDPATYRQTAKKYGFDFPLAVDTDWRTLNSWRGGADTGYTSLTFILDRHGVIRHVHPGGQYAEGDPAYAKINGVVERLLAER